MSISWFESSIVAFTYSYSRFRVLVCALFFLLDFCVLFQILLFVVVNMDILLQIKLFIENTTVNSNFLNCCRGSFCYRLYYSLHISFTACHALTSMQDLIISLG